MVFPKDIAKQGTWIATDGIGRSACLLNGAFEKHIKDESYIKSRGQIVLDSFEYSGFNEFCEKVSLEGIEPFTLLMVDTDPVYCAILLRWDGVKKNIKFLAPQKPIILSSSTLYNKEAREKRQQWFDSWIEDFPLSQESILDFHNRRHGSDPEIDVLMKRPNGIQSVSISQVLHTASCTDFTYLDLIKDVTHAFTLKSKTAK